MTAADDPLTLRDQGAVCPGPGGDPAWWYSGDLTAQAKARVVCLGCPALLPCREIGRREPDGMWGGLNQAQRDMQGLALPPRRWCWVCRAQLADDNESLVCGEQCTWEAKESKRRQASRESSADRTCRRCDTAMSPQSRVCLVCEYRTWEPLPNRPWPAQ